MPTLRETIDRLVSALASDIIAAIRDMPIGELTRLTARGPARTERPAARVHRSNRTTTRRRRTRSGRSSAAPPRLDAGTIEAAQRFFAERGRRGATEPQMHDSLHAQGFSLGSDAIAALMRALLERGSIRDAGFRRTTGKGTAPVYVLATNELSPTLPHR